MPRTVRMTLMARLGTILAAAILCTARAPGQGYVCAEGGGSVASGEWSAPVLRWMISKARPDGGPRVVVLGSRDPGQPLDAGDGEEDRICARFLEAGAVEAKSLWINSDNAAGRAMAAAIEQADIVWIRGGAQSRYCRFWKDTPIESAIRAVFRRGGVIGGTSAGCAVLGEIAYDALGGSCAPLHALRDGRAKEISFTTGFLDLVPGVLFDTHFGERGRLARLAVMLARCRADLRRDIVGVGMDTRTALCISPDGAAEVIGQGAVSILRLSPESHVDVAGGHPPTVTNVSLAQLLNGQRLDMNTWRVLDERNGRVAPEPGEQAPAGLPVTPRIFADVHIDGAELALSSLGELRIVDGGNQEALWRGELSVLPGDASLKGVALQCRTFDDRGYVENRIGGVLYAAAEHPGILGVWLNAGAQMHAAGSRLTLSAARVNEAAAPVSAMILETAGIRAINAGRERASADSAGPRQVAGFQICIVHVLAPGWGYDADARCVLPPEAARAEKPGKP